MNALRQHNINPREKKLIVVIIILITGYVLFNVVMMPVMQQFQGLRETLQSREIKLMKYRKAASQKEVVSQKLEQLLPQFEQLTASANPLPKVIENLQRELNLSKSTLSPRESEDMYQFTKNEIDMEMEESFENLVTFIFQLKNQPERVNLKSLRIVANEGNTSRLRAFLTLVQYIPNIESNIPNAENSISNTENNIPATKNKQTHVTQK